MLAVLFSVTSKSSNPSVVTLSKSVIACWGPGFNDFSVCHNVLFDVLKLNDLKCLLTLTYNVAPW